MCKSGAAQTAAGKRVLEARARAGRKARKLMYGCGTEFRLDAYHDGELDAEERSRVAEHVQGCAACAEALEQMRRMTLLLGGERHSATEDVSQDEIARLHAAVDREANRSAFQIDRSFWRTAVVLSGLAASVLIIASAWLMETPAPRTHVATQPIGPEAPWERYAMTLRADPLPYAGPEANPDQSALADAHANMTSWMLDNLKGQVGR